jgi:hypothetical protein
LPRPRVVLVRLGRSIGAMLVLDSSQSDSAEHPLVIRFRPAPDSPLSDLQRFSAMPNEPVWPRSRSMLGGRVCVQAGVEIGAEVLFEPWTCLPASEAVDYTELLRERNSAGNGAL